MKISDLKENDYILVTSEYLEINNAVLKVKQIRDNGYNGTLPIIASVLNKCDDNDILLEPNEIIKVIRKEENPEYFL